METARLLIKAIKKNKLSSIWPKKGIGFKLGRSFTLINAKKAWL